MRIEKAETLPLGLHSCCRQLIVSDGNIAHIGVLVVDNQVRPVRGWELTFTTSDSQSTIHMRKPLFTNNAVFIVVGSYKCKPIILTHGKNGQKRRRRLPFEKGNCLVVDNSKFNVYLSKTHLTLYVF